MKIISCKCDSNLVLWLMSPDISTPVTPRWLFLFHFRVTSISGKCWTIVRLWGEIEESEKSSVVRNLTQVNLAWAPPVLCHQATTTGQPPALIIFYFKCGASCSKLWTPFRSWVCLQCVCYPKNIANHFNFTSILAPFPSVIAIRVDSFTLVRLQLPWFTNVYHIGLL